MDNRQYILEKYFVLTNLSPREAMDKHGFWLDPAETRFINGVKHYRVIYPRSEKGGWASSYSSGNKIDPEVKINSIKHTKRSDPE